MWYLKTGVERTDCQQIVYKLVRFLVMVIREREMCGTSRLVLREQTVNR